MLFFQLILIVITCIITWKTADFKTNTNRNIVRGYLVLFAIASVFITIKGTVDSAQQVLDLSAIRVGLDSLGMKYDAGTKTIEFNPTAGIVSIGDGVTISGNTVWGNGADRFRPGVFKDSLTPQAKQELAHLLRQKYSIPSLKRTKMILIVSPSQIAVLDQVDSIVKANGGSLVGWETHKSNQEFPAPQQIFVSDYQDTTYVTIGIDPLILRDYYRKKAK
jgi:hypothetical protein